MQKQSKPIGEIFVGMGRLTPADVERALAYQREQGGIFGDALVTLGLLTPEEVKWGLADQYDVPFVQLRPENIDWDTAVRVPARWAREHTILPVLRHGTTVTAVMADPRNMGLLEEIRRLTGAERVEAALSTTETIQALIEAVHGHEADERLISLQGLIAEALAAGAREFGVSVRGQRIRGWYRASRMEQRTLDVDWTADLQRLVAPQYLLAGSEPIRQWSAVLQLEGAAWRVQCRAVGQGGEMEWMAHVSQRLASPDDAVRLDAPIAEWMARQSEGAAVVRVHPAVPAVPAEVLRAKLPLLPQLLLGEPRSVHLHTRADTDYGEVLAAPVAGPLGAALRELEPFGLDALTLDLHTLNESELNAARGVARLVVFHARREDPDPLPADLHVCLRTDGGDLLWTEAATSHGAD